MMKKILLFSCAWVVCNCTAATWYVNGGKANDSGTGKSWGTAKKTIQAAINASGVNDTILVTNGTYETIVSTNRQLTISSMNGPEFTFIDGAGAARCATLGITNGSTRTVLSGFTLTNGFSEATGGGVYAGTLEGCVLVDNRAPHGGGAADAVLNNCVIIGNTATGDGGGVLSSTLRNCLLRDNEAQNGGGAAASTLNCCIVLYNTATANGGGTYGGNQNSCTYAANIAAIGGGANSGTVINSILWDNVATDNGDDVFVGTGSVTYSCASDAPDAEGNITSNPLFANTAEGNYRLVETSPCKNAGTNDVTLVSTDFEGKSRIRDGRNDMGAYEYPIGTKSLYVSAVKTDDTGDGFTWATAKKTIQAAIDLAEASDTVTVTNGTYTPITTSNKNILITSVNGADVTTINGSGNTRCATLGEWYDETDTTLMGFTLTRGKADDGGGAAYGMLISCILTANSATVRGGGAYNCSLINCTLSNNSTAGSGGGAKDSTLSHCLVTGNTSTLDGAGTYHCLLDDCLVTGNKAVTAIGGGTSGDSIARNCTFVSNTASNGAGVASSTLYNCIVWDNTVPTPAASTDTNTPVATVTLHTNAYSTIGFNNCSPDTISGTGNTKTNPQFANATGADYRLKASSPCIDTGTNEFVNSALDLAGLMRIRNEVVDMGAYEGAVVTVNYNGNGGTVSPTSKIMTVGDPFGTLPTPKRTSYLFDKWTPDKNGTLDEVTEETIVPGTNATVNLYAQWLRLWKLTINKGTTLEGTASTSLLTRATCTVKANPAPVAQEFQKWTLSPSNADLGEEFDIFEPTNNVVMPDKAVTITAVYIKSPGSLKVNFLSDTPEQTVSGVQWSVDNRTWMDAEDSQRLTAKAYTLYFRSPDSKWIPPKTLKITLPIGPEDDPLIVDVECAYAPAFDADELANATDPNSSDGAWDDAAGQLNWTGLRVGLRAELGPLPLAPNATSAKLKSGKLPTGLKLAVRPDGVYLAGIPTKVGAFPATLQAIEGKTLGALLPVEFTVGPLLPEYIGTFNGACTVITNGIAKHSALTLTVAKTGKLSGSINLGGKKHSIKADAFDTIDYADETMFITNAAFICTSPKLTNSVSLTISTNSVGFGVFAVESPVEEDADTQGWAVRNGWKDRPVNTVRSNELVWARGYYTVALRSADDSYGNGYVTLTVDAKGSVRVSGKLADGTSASGSGVLLVTGTEASTVIALNPSAYKGGEFYLNVRFVQGTPPYIESAAPASWVNTVTTSSSDGPFERAPLPVGKWYSQLTDLYAIYNVESPYRVGVDAEVITNDVSLAFNTKGTGVDALPRTNNAYNVKLTLTPKTGLFSGSFNETDVKTAYKLYGILTPGLVEAEETAGLGFYLVPDVIPAEKPIKTKRSERFRLIAAAE